MAHPLIDQLRFTRSKWMRALDGVPASGGPASTPLSEALRAWPSTVVAAEPRGG